MDAIAQLHRDMSRQGPGAAADVQWALDGLGVPQDARIMDAGCGPGADLMTLAQARPKAQIEGVEVMAHLADEARAACADLPNVQISQGDMAALTGPYDLIWCAGALYFLGVTEGLNRWRSALAPKGGVAFSEPVLVSETSCKFWADYPAVSDLEGIKARVKAAGFETVDHQLIGAASWADYYSELGARVALLRPGATGALLDLLQATEREISMWQQSPDDVAYALMLVRPKEKTDDI